MVRWQPFETVQQKSAGRSPTTADVLRNMSHEAREAVQNVTENENRIQTSFTSRL